MSRINSNKVSATDCRKANILDHIVRYRVVSGRNLAILVYAALDQELKLPKDL